MLHDPTIETDEYGQARGRGRRVLAIAAVAIVLLAVLLIYLRHRDERTLATVAADAAIPAVTVVVPKHPKGDEPLVLPGAVQAYNTAAIYARTSGYVRRWLVDIGDPVRAGQTLAILDTPEVEQQLAQARADYETARANQSLARTTAQRWASLLGKDAVSRQEADEKAGDLAAKSAVANAQLANVRRLQALSGFSRLEAPFAGVVTSRSAQIGALVTTGNAAAVALFSIADVSRVRVYVRVPQGASSAIHVGLHAGLRLPEYPGRTFDGTVTRSSGAVDAQSGSMLVEVQAANGDRALKPGAYAQVSFDAKAGANGGLQLPATALMFGGDGATVALVGKDGRVTIRTVTIGRDYGKTVEIASGLKGGEKVIDSPPDAIVNGDRVRVEAADAAS